MVDNTTTVAQVNRMGGTKSLTLFTIVKELWDHCLSHQITLTACHLPGVCNLMTNEESRVYSNWTLDQEIFNQISKVWGPFKIDLFADRLNCRLETRYIGSGNRLIPNALAESSGICFPTILPNRQLPYENTEGTSRDGDDNTTVASPDLVPHVIGDVHMLSNTVTTSTFPASVPSGSNPSPCSDKGITVGGLEVVGEGPGSTKISEHAETLVR